MSDPEATGDPLFTPDELEAIDADLSETDKNTAGPADAGDTVSVTEEQGDPVAAGVDPDRATKWAIFDTERLAYSESSVRDRPPTAKQRERIARANEECGRELFVWHRV